MQSSFEEYVTTATTAGIVPADDDLEGIDAVSMDDPASVFQGYDSFMSAIRSAAVTGTTKSTGASSAMTYTICTTMEEINNALSISASVSASCGFGSVDAKSEFVSKLKVTRTSVHLVAYAKAVTQATQFDNVSLKITAPGDAKTLFRTYGDSFVSAIERGGEYAAVFSFQSRTTDEQTDVLTTLNVNGISTQGTIEASLQVNLQNAFRNIETTKSLTQFVRGSTASAPDADDIVQFALDFPSKVSATNPVTLSYATSSYVRVPDFPPPLIDDFLTIQDNVALFIGSPDEPGLTALFAKANSLAASVTELEDLYRFYAYSADTALPENKKLLLSDIQTLKTQFKQMEKDPTREYTSPRLNCSGWTPPVLNYSLGATSLSGGGGDQPFNDVAADHVRQKTRIAEIIGWGGNVLDSITTTYSRAGIMHRLDRRGGDGGDNQSTLSLQPGQRITSIQTRFGDVVNWISFKGADFEVTCPRDPQGCDGQGYWAEPADGCTRLLGFTGSFGNVLDHLEAVTVRFSPATFGPA